MAMSKLANSRVPRKPLTAAQKKALAGAVVAAATAGLAFTPAGSVAAGVLAAILAALGVM